MIRDFIRRPRNRQSDGCSSLAEVIVPDTVTTIGQTAFHDCINLEYLALSANVTSIYDDTSFSGCGRLAIDAPEGSVAWNYAQTYGFVPETCVLQSPHPYGRAKLIEDGTFSHSTGLRVTAPAGSYAYRWAEQNGKLAGE